MVMLLTIIYGTRPEFLKIKSLIDKLKKFKYNIQVIRINQHENLLEDKGYYDDILNITNMCDDRINNIGANILSKLPSMIKDSTHILAQGDTASVFYAMLCGFQLKKICVHLEAGMRTYDLENPYPEEGFRQMISRISDINLCPSLEEQKYLITEKTKGITHVVGNTILDLVKSYNINITYENIAVITLHRRENWSNYKEYIEAIYNLVQKHNSIKFYFLTHPNPSLRKIIDDINTTKNIDNLIILESLPHKDLMNMLAKCAFVITDSGGIQEEANFLGKHIYMLRKVTERGSISKEKITVVDQNNIADINVNIKNHSQGYEYGDGRSVDKIINILYK
jgi:UDP-N-acetylglucosamine 2-epimerase (non-hydrolysing)